MRVLLLTPPLIQLNTPYPATAYLTGFLRSEGVDARQADPAIDLIHKLFCRTGLQAIRKKLDKPVEHLSPAIKFFLDHYDSYAATVDPVMRFLRGLDPTLAMRIAPRSWLPEGPRFRVLSSLSKGLGGGEDPLEWAFGHLGIQDRAKYLSTLYLDDLADVVRDGIDPHFELSRYGEKLAAAATSFDPMATALQRPLTLVDEFLREIVQKLLAEHGPDCVGMTVPFPGNLYGALRISQFVKQASPKTKVFIGGGYVNTELRDLTEPRFFEHVDFVTLDDGELPIRKLLEHLSGKVARLELVRTFYLEEGKVIAAGKAVRKDVSIGDWGTPTYDGLPLDRYLSVCELLNPMHRVWSDGRWNKLTLAHGCYWAKCSFCDTSLDYISRYEEQSLIAVVEKMDRIASETGQSGFHFVDEAAPPKMLFGLSKKLIEEQRTYTWWGNVRFEKSFNSQTAQLMRDAGCVAVSGGLEVASDRLLKLMDKGVTFEQVARVTHAFAEADIMVHAYLMYGFPSQTAQETIDALERVRQLFIHGCIHSAFWHRFALTVHSPIAKNPEKFGIRVEPLPADSFARNDLGFVDSVKTDHDALGRGLKKAVYNFMHGIGLEDDVRVWFDLEVPRAKVAPNLIASHLKQSRAKK